MLLFYALEKRGSWFILAFAGSCVLGSIYGFLQGAWPFGPVEIAWAIVAARRWWLAMKGIPGRDRSYRPAGAGDALARFIRCKLAAYSATPL